MREPRKAGLLAGNRSISELLQISNAGLARIGAGEIHEIKAVRQDGMMAAAIYPNSILA